MPETKPKVTHVDEQMEQRLQHMMDSTWDQCAGDWLQMAGRKYVKGTEVQECVADADRFDMADDKVAAEVWRSLDRAYQDKLLNKWFPPKMKFGY